jgi:hypothetical protein
MANLHNEEDDQENDNSVTILPYDDGLEPWAELHITNSNRHISWEDHTWQTAMYCGTNYEYFVVRPPHQPCFVGLTHCCHQVFGNSKQTIGKPIGQEEEGIAFGMSGI